MLLLIIGVFHGKKAIPEVQKHLVKFIKEKSSVTFAINTEMAYRQARKFVQLLKHTVHNIMAVLVSVYGSFNLSVHRTTTLAQCLHQ